MSFAHRSIEYCHPVAFFAALFGARAALLVGGDAAFICAAGFSAALLAFVLLGAVPAVWLSIRGRQ